MQEILKQWKCDYDKNVNVCLPPYLWPPVQREQEEILKNWNFASQSTWYSVQNFKNTLRL